MRTDHADILSMLLDFREDERSFRRHFVSACSCIGEEKYLSVGLKRQEAICEKLETIICEVKKYKKLRDDLFLNIGHEIRTPLNGIVGFSDLIGQETLSGKEREEYAKIINVSTFRLLKVLEDVLDVARIYCGNLKMKYEEVDVDEFCGAILSSFEKLRVEEGKNDIYIVFKKPAEPGLRIFTDRYRLEQILNNLLDNSLKFSKRGEICFGYDVVKSDVSFFVTDQGIGIPEKMVKTISHHFTDPLPEDPAVSCNNTGLGLLICNGIVSLMQGRISVNSKIGQGTTVKFDIPMIKAENENLYYKDFKKY
ncbi:MAG TPA: HAMP domain-containing sensor histidine kinase [Candidatus Egerieousia sp.]|nr:HAMP domain-containing sensor histidine kinase [Candidatus Egerieousia sp.]HPT05219.1 HAMP domain-containing sensor histidine kinase [Candidatus Egerieousia sp.]